MRTEIVERLLGPGAAGELGDERGRLRHELIVVAQLAECAQIKEAGLGLA